MNVDGVGGIRLAKLGIRSVPLPLSSSSTLPQHASVKIREYTVGRSSCDALVTYLRF